MLIKIYDHRIVASEVSWFHWSDKDVSEGNGDDKKVIPCLVVYMKIQDLNLTSAQTIYIKGPKTLLDDFEKQYNEIMGGK